MALAIQKPSKRRNCKQEDDEPRTGMETLQLDIALDILSRLPITSLMQFRFVSRACHMLSYDPNLVSLHLSQASKTNPFLILHCDYPIRNQLCFVELSEHLENEIVRKIQTPFWDVMPEFNVIGSCNGLLCLSDSLYSDPLYILNPFTREYKQLPKTRQFDDQEVVFGFGFHPVTKEYKVVKIVMYWNHYNAVPGYRRRRRHCPTGSDVLVHNLSNTSWRSVGKVPYRLEQRASEALVNGRLHWLTKLQFIGHRVHRRRSIVSFDLADEQFREVPKPDCGDLNRLGYQLTVLGGCLSAIIFCPYMRIEVLVMSEYNVEDSWIKKFTIEDYSKQFIKPRVLPSYGIWRNVLRQKTARVLCLLDSGNVLIEFKGGVLASYDPYNGAFRKLMFEGMPGLFRSVVHVGTLMGLKNPFVQV